MVGEVALGKRIRRVTLKIAGITDQVNTAAAQLLHARFYPTSNLQNSATDFSTRVHRIS